MRVSYELRVTRVKRATCNDAREKRRLRQRCSSCLGTSKLHMRRREMELDARG